MSENRFFRCHTVESVLWHYHELAREGFSSTALDTPAVARIKELIRDPDEVVGVWDIGTARPVVDKAAYDRARTVLSDAMRLLASTGYGHSAKIMAVRASKDLLDRIIGVLGYQPPAPESPRPFPDVKPKLWPETVVELAAEELRVLGDIVDAYENLHDMHDKLAELVGIDQVPPHFDVLIDEKVPTRVVQGKDCWLLQIGVGQ